MAKTMLSIGIAITFILSGSALADNHKKKAKAAVLVVGGFHSRGLKERFSKAGFTTISVTPKITKVDSKSGSQYLSVFTREKTDSPSVVLRALSGELFRLTPSRPRGPHRRARNRW